MSKLGELPASVGGFPQAHNSLRYYSFLFSVLRDSLLRLQLAALHVCSTASMSQDFRAAFLPTQTQDKEHIYKFTKHSSCSLWSLTFVGSHRPIALANMVYKVWTGVISHVMSVYAEHFHQLSDCQ